MRFGNFAIFTHVPFTFFRFFGQDVTLETLLMRDLSGCRYFKSLFGAGVCLYLRHFKCFYITPLRRSRSAGTLGGPLQAIVSLNEGRKDKGFDLSSNGNLQKYLILNITASMFNLILQIYAQTE